MYIQTLNISTHSFPLNCWKSVRFKWHLCDVFLSFRFDCVWALHVQCSILAKTVKEYTKLLNAGSSDIYSSNYCRNNAIKSFHLISFLPNFFVCLILNGKRISFTTAWTIEILRNFFIFLQWKCVPKLTQIYSNTRFCRYGVSKTIFHTSKGYLISWRRIETHWIELEKNSMILPIKWILRYWNKYEF